MKTIAILGSTGSIGTQTLEVVRQNKDIQVAALSAGENIELLEKQIREFRPALAAVWDQSKAKELKTKVADLPTMVLAGMEGLLAVAEIPQAAILVTAIVGMIGLRPTVAAIKAGKNIALANKETLVAAGHLIMPLAKQYQVEILPVDSEHSAVFQAINGEKRSSLRKILLTASGGPFRGRTRSSLIDVTPEAALKHPNWNMGAKITIDSATLVNKGLEMMEAKWLFDMGIEDIQVVVQPGSIIHSMVELTDGAVMAQLGVPDMKLPIQYALYYPERRPLPGERLDFWQLTQLVFEQPDTDTFLGIPLAVRAAKCGGSMPAVYNAANEMAVAKFLKRDIGFLDIYEIIEEAMNKHVVMKHPDIDEILAVEQATYDWIESRW